MWHSSSLRAWWPVLLIAAIVACDGGSPTSPTPTPSCAFTLSTNSLAFSASGGPGSVNVTTAAGCSWAASSDRAWMGITGGASGNGNGTVSVTLTANTAAGERTGTLTVAGQAVAVRQDGAGACTYDIAPTSATFNKDAATGSVAVTAPGHCAWDAASSAAWVAITAGRGTGNGTVAFSVERNRNTTTRSATIAVGGLTFTVTQTGDAGACDYSVSPVEFEPCMSVSSDLTATVTADPGCTWTAAAGASWISVVGGQSGVGSGTVRFRVSDNWTAPRQSVVMVRWPTPTAGQNLQVRQAGCRYAVSVTTITMPVTGGTQRFDVVQSSDPISCGGPLQNACVWSAVSSVSWVTITTAMPRVGDNPVSFAVTANTTGATRSGTIRVRDRVVTVTQAGS
jgi:hypothetical protein